MDETDKQFLATLRVSDPSDDKTRIEKDKGGLLEDSYRWILDNPSFGKWRGDDQSRPLWINGPAGIGKTMLLCGIIDSLSSPHEKGRLVSFFFCQGSFSWTRNATAVLCGLAYLLVRQNPSLISHVREKLGYASKSHFEGINGWEAISKILQSMLQDDALPPVYLIVDALDECETGVEELLGFINKTTSAEHSRVKWLVSSRHDDTIENILATGVKGPNLGLDINPILVSQAVDIYIEYQVSQFKLIQHDKPLQKQVYKKLHENAGGTFLWVALVFEELRKLKLAVDVRRAIDETPSSVGKLYKTMVNRVATLEQHSQSCFRILWATAIAYRPLHLLELQTLASLEETMDTEDLKRLARLCGSFLVVRDHHVYPIHHSAKEYLTQNASVNLSPAEVGPDHFHIFTRSLRGLSNVLRRNIYEIQSPGTLIGDVAPPDPDPLVPVRYSCLFWYQHLCDAKILDSQYSIEFSDSGTLFTFLKESFLYWIESLSLLEQIPVGVHVIHQVLCAVQVRILFPISCSLPSNYS